MKRFSLIIASSLIFSACTVHTVNLEDRRLNAARQAIAASKVANAETCAPKLQAQAVAALYSAAHEINEGGHIEEETQLAEDTVNYAHAAIAKCQPPVAAKPAVIIKPVAIAPVIVPPTITVPIPTPPVVVMDKIIQLDGVNFHTNSSLLTKASTSILDQAVATLKKRANIHVEVAAHTDSDASAKYNLWLSNRRADSVMKYLISHGIDAKRLTFNGYGEAEPIASNASKAGRARNRRVELRIM